MWSSSLYLNGALISLDNHCSCSMGTGGSFPALKQLWHEISHSPPSSAEVKNDWSYTSTPPVCLCDMDRDNCTCLTTVFGLHRLICFQMGIKMSTFLIGSIEILISIHTDWGTAVAQWLRCCATNQKVAGLIPHGVIGIFHWHNPTDHTMALGSSQPRNRYEYQEYFLGVKAAGA